MSEQDMSTSAIDDLIGRLPQKLEPREDLWPSIKSAIDTEAAAMPDTVDYQADDAMSRLPAGIAPPDGLWRAIAEQIGRADAEAQTDASASARYGWMGLAASIVLVAIVSLTFARVDDIGRLLPPYDASTGISEPSVDDLEWLAAGNTEAAPVFSPQVATAFEETRRTYLSNIAEVRGQRELIEDSLQRYPDDSALRALWLHTYQTELLLIDEAGRVLTSI